MSHDSNKPIVFSLCLSLAFIPGIAQPNVDIGKLSYYYTPASDKSSTITSQLYSINVTLPIELKKGGDVILLNPFFVFFFKEKTAYDIHVSSAGMMIGFLKKEAAGRWDVMTGVI